jgi:hypothetical protein
MRPLLASLLAAVLLCANGRPAYAAPAAASQNFPPVLTASGEVSCGEFIEDQRVNSSAVNTALMNLFVVWVVRFLSDYDHRGFSAENVGQADGQVDLPDRATVLSFLQHYCEHNPSSNVYRGALALRESRHRSGLESKQRVIVGRLRVRKTRTPPRARRA